MSEEGKAIVFIILVSLCICTIPPYFYAKYSCGQKYFEFQNRFGILTGCMVYHNEKWLPVERLRFFEDE